MAKKAPHDLCCSLGVIAVIQAEEIGSSCSRHVGGEECVQCSVGNLKERDHLKNVGVE